MMLAGIISAQNYYVNPLQSFEGKTISILGYCIDDPKTKNSNTKQCVKINKIQIGETIIDIHAKIFLNIKVAEIEPAYGDLLIFETKLYPLREPLNAFEFSYKDFAKHQGIFHQAYIKGRDLHIIDDGHGLKFQTFLRKQRKHAISILEEYFTKQKHLGILAALVLGEKKELDQASRIQFSESGTIHVLAVSGLHVGIIWSIIGFLLSPLKYIKHLGPKTIPLLSIIGIWAFAFFTGAASPVLRASIILTFLLVGKILEREIYIFNLLALAALLILIFEPGQIFQIGFQFSFLAVTSIILFFEKIEKLIYSRFKIIQYVWKIMAVSFAAQILVLPLSIYYFHQFPTYFFINSLVVIPLAYVLIGGNLLLFAMESIYPKVNIYLAKAQSFLIEGMDLALSNMNSIPYHLIENLYPSITLITFIYLLILTCSIAIFFKFQNIKRYGFLLLIIVTSLKTMEHYSKQIDNLYISGGSRDSQIVFNAGNTSFILQPEPNKYKNSGYAIRSILEFYEKREQCALSIDDYYQNRLIAKNGNYIFFKGHKILLWNSSSANLKINYFPSILIIQDNTPLPNNIHPEAILIFDSSNHADFILKAQSELKTSGIQNHSCKNAKGVFFYFSKHKALWKKIHFILTRTNVMEYWL